MRDRFKDETRAAILEAAEGVFASDGVLTARMEAVASKAGVAVGTLYNHFADRHALVDALMKVRQGELLGRLDESLEVHDGRPFVAQLDAFVASLQEHFTAHAGFVRVLMDSDGQNFGKKVLQPHEMIAQLRDRLELLVKRGVKSKDVRADDAELFAWFFFGAMRSMMARRVKGLATESLAEQRAALVRFLMQGAQYEPRGRR